MVNKKRKTSRQQTPILTKSPLSQEPITDISVEGASKTLSTPSQFKLRRKKIKSIQPSSETAQHIDFANIASKENDAVPNDSSGCNEDSLRDIEIVDVKVKPAALNSTQPMSSHVDLNSTSSGVLAFSPSIFLNESVFGIHPPVYNVQTQAYIPSYSFQGLSPTKVNNNGEMTAFPFPPVINTQSGQNFKPSSSSSFTKPTTPQPCQAQNYNTYIPCMQGYASSVVFSPVIWACGDGSPSPWTPTKFLNTSPNNNPAFIPPNSFGQNSPRQFLSPKPASNSSQNNLRNTDDSPSLPKMRKLQDTTFSPIFSPLGNISWEGVWPFTPNMTGSPYAAFNGIMGDAHSNEVKVDKTEVSSKKEDEKLRSSDCARQLVTEVPANLSRPVSQTLNRVVLEHTTEDDLIYNEIENTKTNAIFQIKSPENATKKLSSQVLKKMAIRRAPACTKNISTITNHPIGPPNIVASNGEQAASCDAAKESVWSVTVPKTHEKISTINYYPENECNNQSKNQLKSYLHPIPTNFSVDELANLVAKRLVECGFYKNTLGNPTLERNSDKCAQESADSQTSRSDASVCSPENFSKPPSVQNQVITSSLTTQSTSTSVCPTSNANVGQSLPVDLSTMKDAQNQISSSSLATQSTKEWPISKPMMGPTSAMKGDFQPVASSTPLDYCEPVQFSLPHDFQHLSPVLNTTVQQALDGLPNSKFQSTIPSNSCGVTIGSSILPPLATTMLTDRQAGEQSCKIDNRVEAVHLSASQNENLCLDDGQNLQLLCGDGSKLSEFTLRYDPVAKIYTLQPGSKNQGTLHSLEPASPLPSLAHANIVLSQGMPLSCHLPTQSKNSVTDLRATYAQLHMAPSGQTNDNVSNMNQLISQHQTQVGHTADSNTTKIKQQKFTRDEDVRDTLQTTADVESSLNALSTTQDLDERLQNQRLLGAFTIDTSYEDDVSPVSEGSATTVVTENEKQKMYNYVIETVHIGKFKYCAKLMGRKAEMKIFVEHRRILYELELIDDKSGTPVALFETDFDSITNLEQEDQKTLSIAVSANPELFLGYRKVFVDVTDETYTNYSKCNFETLVTGGHLGTTPVHKITFSNHKAVAVLLTLANIDSRFQALLQQPLDGQPSAGVEDRATGLAMAKLPEVLPDTMMEVLEESGGPLVTDAHKCACVHRCEDSRCGCITRSIPCGPECSCCKSLNNCCNPINRMALFGLNIYMVAADPCMTRALFTQVKVCFKELERSCVLPCCNLTVPIKCLVPGLFRCPRCPTSRYKYSWCFHKLQDENTFPRRHCPKCDSCADVKHYHCKLCKRCHSVNFMPCLLKKFYQSAQPVTSASSSTVLSTYSRDARHIRSGQVVTRHNPQPAGHQSWRSNGSTRQVSGPIQMAQANRQDLSKQASAGTPDDHQSASAVAGSLLLTPHGLVWSPLGDTSYHQQAPKDQGKLSRRPKTTASQKKGFVPIAPALSAGGSHPSSSTVSLNLQQCVLQNIMEGNQRQQHFVMAIHSLAREDATTEYVNAQAASAQPDLTSLTSPFTLTLQQLPGNNSGLQKAFIQRKMTDQ